MPGTFQYYPLQPPTNPCYVVAAPGDHLYHRTQWQSTGLGCQPGCGHLRTLGDHRSEPHHLYSHCAALIDLRLQLVGPRHEPLEDWSGNKVVARAGDLSVLSTSAANQSLLPRGSPWQPIGLGCQPRGRHLRTLGNHRAEPHHLYSHCAALIDLRLQLVGPRHEPLEDWSGNKVVARAGDLSVLSTSAANQSLLPRGSPWQSTGLGCQPRGRDLRTLGDHRAEPHHLYSHCAALIDLRLQLAGPRHEPLEDWSGNKVVARAGDLSVLSTSAANPCYGVAAPGDHLYHRTQWQSIGLGCQPGCGHLRSLGNHRAEPHHLYSHCAALTDLRLQLVGPRHEPLEDWSSNKVVARAGDLSVLFTSDANQSLLRRGSPWRPPLPPNPMVTNWPRLPAKGSGSTHSWRPPSRATPPIFPLCSVD